MTLAPIEFHLPNVSSTSDYARELLRTYPFVFVSAMYQTAGRGRNGRMWHGDYGSNVYCSLGISHNDATSISELATFMALGALAVLETLREQAPDAHFRLKYPNDVQASFNGVWSKIAGILIEHEFQGQRCTSTIVGIGVNVNQKVFPNTIGQSTTSLYLMGYTIELPRFVQQLKVALTNFRHIPSAEVFQSYVNELGILGKRIRIMDDPSTWIVVRVLDDGRLHVRSEVTQIDRNVIDGDTIRYED